MVQGAAARSAPFQPELAQKFRQPLMNSTSRVMPMSSPTSTPPVSSAEFQVRPKSFRLILVVAERPMRVLPQGSLPGALGPSTAKVTGLVMPCMVRSPFTFEIIMCFTLNSAAEWAGSRFQVIREAGVTVVVAMGGGSFHLFGCGTQIFVATSIKAAAPIPAPAQPQNTTGQS